MTPELQQKRDDQAPLTSRLKITISVLSKRNWYDTNDLRRLLLDCLALAESVQACKDINKYDDMPARQAE